MMMFALEAKKELPCCVVKKVRSLGENHSARKCNCALGFGDACLFGLAMFDYDVLMGVY